MFSFSKKSKILSGALAIAIATSTFPHEAEAESRECGERLALIAVGALTIGSLFFTAGRWVNADRASYTQLQQTVIQSGKVNSIRNADVRTATQDVLKQLDSFQNKLIPSDTSNLLPQEKESISKGLMDSEIKLLQTLRTNLPTLSQDEKWTIREIGYHLYQIHGGPDLGMPWIDPTDSRPAFHIIDLMSK